MKKMGICLIAILFSFFCFTDAFAQRGMKWQGSGNWGPGSPYNRMFDPKTVGTITGEVGIFLLSSILPFSHSAAEVTSSPSLPSTDPPAATEGKSLSLEQAVDLALRRNPLTQSAATGRKIANASAEEALAGRWPLLQFSETFTRSNNPVFVFGSLLEQGRFGPQNFAVDSLNNPDPLNNFRTAVNLKWPSSTRCSPAPGWPRPASGRNRQTIRRRW